MFRCCCGNKNITGTHQVIAGKVWHGDRAPIPEPCDLCDVETVRYLTCKYTYRIEISDVTDEGGTGPLDYSASMTVTIDKNTGNSTIVDCDAEGEGTLNIVSSVCGSTIYMSYPIGRTALARIELPACVDPYSPDTPVREWSGNTYLVKRWADGGEGCPGWYYRETMSCEYSDPYTRDDLIADANTLLAEVALTAVPKGQKRVVTRNENPNSPNTFFGSWKSTAYNYPNVLYADPCTHDQFSTDPTGAIEISSVGDFPCGHFNDYDGLTLWRSKWAEKKIKVCSHNWFRPGGQDRFLTNGANLTTVSAVNNANPAAPIVTVGTHSFVAGDVVILMGGTLDRTAWKVASVSGSNITLGTKSKAGQEWFDFAKAYLPMECGNIMAAPRFPTAWPIMGRTRVVSATQIGGSVIVTMADAAPHDVGDSLTFDSVAGLTTHVITEVTSSTVVKVTATVGSYTSGGYVKSTGAPDHVWDNNDYSGKFYTKTFNYTGCGEVGDEYVFQCTDVSGELVSGSLVIAPTDEGITPIHLEAMLAPPPFYTGVNDDIIQPIPQVIFHQSSNYKVFVQTMADPLWQYGNHCYGSPVWDFIKSGADAGGACSPNWMDGETFTQYGVHALPPQEEPVMAVPSGAPALPGGFSLFITDCDASYLPGISGPYQAHMFCGYLNPNWYLPGMAGCVSGEGRFAAAYEIETTKSCATRITAASRGVYADSPTVTANDGFVTPP